MHCLLASIIVCTLVFGICGVDSMSECFHPCIAMAQIKALGDENGAGYFRACWETHASSSRSMCGRSRLAMTSTPLSATRALAPAERPICARASHLTFCVGKRVKSFSTQTGAHSKTLNAFSPEKQGYFQVLEAETCRVSHSRYIFALDVFRIICHPL